VLLKLEEMQDEQIKQALAPKEETVTMTGDERAEAMELLRDPRLLDRIVEDFARCGVVGEETNKLAGYLGVVSRHLESPLAVIVQSSSAAGKSSLMEAVLAFVPDEQRVQYSDDGTITVLHGRDRSQAQSAGHRGRRGCALGSVCVEAASE
jgi:type IV secretory pathway ATPase VirB11/archaellum biosynthesis ATPase